MADHSTKNESTTSERGRSQSSWTPAGRVASKSRFTGRITGRSTRSTSWQPSALDLSNASGGHPVAGDPSLPAAVSWVGRLRPRHLVVALSLAAAAAAVFAMTRTDTSLEPVAHRPLARVELSHGSVATAEGDAVGPGFQLAFGRTLTTGADGGVALRLASGPSVRLDADSRARLTAESELLLERGALYVDARGSAQVEIRTSLGSVRDLGTQFEVRLESAGGADQRLQIRVREGTVLLMPDSEPGAKGTTYTARVGEQLILNAQGDVLRGPSPTYGSHWNWVVRTAPLPTVEGESLRAFLDWLAREGGWGVRYADRHVEDVAAATILHGDLDAMAPTDAAAMVLRSSGLDYRIEQNVLEIAARDASTDGGISSP